MAKVKRFRGLALSAAVVAAGITGAWYYLDAKSDQAPAFNTTTVTRGDITQAVTATGDLEPVVTVDVGAQVSGQVTKVLVDFNSEVKAGQVLALIDPLPAQQKLRQAEADLASARASNQLTKITAERTRELAAKNLVSQSDLDTANANLAQSNATLLTRTAAVENAKLDLDHCTIASPIDGMVLNRNTDPGRMVNSSMNAPTLFTLVNDLTKMQINAAVAEADVGSIDPGQDVTFTVDAFPNRTFRGVVRQVRNAATINQNVVSYATIIDVNNRDLKLKPGMTANVSIVVAHQPNVLRVSNAALRARIPQELLPTPPETAASRKSGAPTRVLSETERRAAMRSAMSEAEIQFGSPATPEQVAKFRQIAQEKGLAEEQISRIAELLAAGGRGRRGDAANGRSGGAGMPVVTRTVYILKPDGRTLEARKIRLGISDGMNTQIIQGLAEGDRLVTSVTMPNAIAETNGGMRSPFQQRGHFGGFGHH